ncbi:MAG: recombination mediator RecR [Chloroflexi bacterium]|nr:recombination mediator RecR [Chloroflexota bacterium]
MVENLGVARPVVTLIDELSHLPQIGPKTAQRLAYFLLRAPRERAQALAQAIIDVKEKIILCEECFNLTEESPCLICASPGRDRRLLCIVEDPIDTVAVERTHAYRGLYHVLHGALNPLEGIGPDELRIRELLARVRRGGVEEVLLATNPTLEGDATADYTARELQRMGFAGVITRLGRGLPVGGDLEYADDLTITRAIESRRSL